MNQAANSRPAPPPCEIESMTALIRAEWSEQEYQKRAVQSEKPDWEVPVVTIAIERAG